MARFRRSRACRQAVVTGVRRRHSGPLSVASACLSTSIRAPRAGCTAAVTGTLLGEHVGPPARDGATIREYANGPCATGGGQPEHGGGSVLAVSTWTHLAATFDGATVRLYVNGAQLASQAQTTPLTTSTRTLQIGGDAYTGENFARLIDEVRIYNRALSAAEIQADMTTPVGGDTAAGHAGADGAGNPDGDGRERADQSAALATFCSSSPGTTRTAGGRRSTRPG